MLKNLIRVLVINDKEAAIVSQLKFYHSFCQQLYIFLHSYLANTFNFNLTGGGDLPSADILTHFPALSELS